MQENLQKGMPQRFKNDPKGVRKTFLLIHVICCDFVGGRDSFIFPPLAEISKNLKN